MKRQLAVLLSAVITLSAVVGGVSTYAASESAAQAVTNQQSSEGETQSSQTSADSVQEAQTVQSTTEEKQSDPVSGQASSENSAVESTEKASENTTAAGAKKNALSAEEENQTGWNADHTQYIKGDGTPATGITDIDGGKYVFSTAGILQKYALVTLDGKTYAADNEGKMVTGWAKIDGSIYFFAPDGHAFKTWSRYMTGNTDRSLHNFGTDGKLLTGLQTVDGKLYYFGPETDTSGTNVDAIVISTADKTISSTRINTGAGKQYTGWVRIDNSIYYFSTSDGHGYKTWSYNMTGNTDKAAYNFGTDGKLLTGLQTINGKTYYFGALGDNSRQNVEITVVNSSANTISKGTMNLGVGRMYKGWLKLNGKTYFMSQTDGHMFKSWSYNVTGNTKGYKYNFGSDGVMLTGWQTIGSDKYYFGTSNNSSAPTAAMTVVNSNGTVSVTDFNLWNGHAYTGEQKIDGKTYYFTSAGVQTTGFTGWKTSGSKHYYYEGGVMQKSGWKTIDGKKYFFASDGHAFQSWSNVSGTRYYFDPNSCYLLVSTSRKINGSTYTFDANGKVIKVESPATNVNSYSSGTKYLVVVHKLSHTLEMYKGKKGSWKRCYGPIVCSVGHLNSSGVSCTPNGVARVVKKQYRMLFAHSCGFYVDWTNRGVGIHSIIFDKRVTSPSSNNYPKNQLGKDISNGCIRVSVANAKYIYNTIGVNTNIVLANN